MGLETPPTRIEALVPNVEAGQNAQFNQSVNDRTFDSATHALPGCGDLIAKYGK